MTDYWKKNSFKQDFVGLSNQGATCYMNSLLQTLFMSFDFRKQIYHWQYDSQKHGNPQDSIPYQLQVLFGKLQLSQSQYTQTTGLTTSFGWDMHQSFQQHDVQQFCRVLFDAIQQSVQGTAQADMIKLLYQGSYVDYVKCLKCLTQSSREDKFLDLSLTVKSPFDNIYNDSIEKALKNYLKPDQLTGDNQYSCETCGGKQDALKGLKFKELPYLLVLQLKRFDLDYNTLQRVKLNDKVSFPQILNMNPLVREVPERAVISEDSKTESEGEDQIEELLTDTSQMSMESSTFDYYEFINQDQDKKPLKLDSIAKKRQIQRRATMKKQERAKLIDTYRQDGPDVYELYSVMIHSGSALGGHYYAYIKSFETDRWYNFNDQTVKEIDEKDLEKVFGGTKRTSYWGSSYSTNAYLLMYRRVDQAVNVGKVLKEEVPIHVLEELEKEKQKEIQAELEKAEKLKYMKIRVYYNKNQKIIQAKKTLTIAQFKQKVMETFKITEIQAANIRIRGYSYYYDLFQETFQQSKTLEQVGLYSGRTVGVETKTSQQEFQQYDPYKLNIKVHVWNQEIASQKHSSEKLLANPVRVSLDKRSTIRNLMQILQEKFGIELSKQRILRKSNIQYSNPEMISSIGVRDQSISYSRIIQGSQLYLQTTDSISKWQAFFMKQANKYTIRFNHPDQKQSMYQYVQANQTVMINSKKTLQKLKEKMSQKLGIPVEEFIMKRGSKYGIQLKDLTLTVKNVNIPHNSIVYIERGQQSRPDQTRIIVHLALPPKPDDYDGIIFSFQELFELSINNNSKFLQVKEKICQKLAEVKPEISATPRIIRLREKYHQKLGKVIKNNDVVKFSNFTDRKAVGIEILTEDEKQMEYTDMLIAVRRWYPSTWELSEAQQVYINKNWKIYQLGQALERSFGIDLDKLLLCRVGYTFNFMRGELETEKFTKANNNFHYLSGQPWYLTSDGSLFIIRDKDEEIRPMTKEEKKKYGTRTTGGWKYESPKEKSLKIRVKKKQVEEEKEEEKVEEVQQ